MKLYDVIEQLRDDGWCETRRASMHTQFSHPQKRGLVTLAGRPDVDVFRQNDIAAERLGFGDKCGRSSYAVVIEQGPSSFGASVPDLPGCIAVGRTRLEVERLIQESITAHIAGLQQDGLEVPEPRTDVITIEVG